MSPKNLSLLACLFLSGCAPDFIVPPLSYDGGPARETSVQEVFFRDASREIPVAEVYVEELPAADTPAELSPLTDTSAPEVTLLPDSSVPEASPTDSPLTDVLQDSGTDSGPADVGVDRPVPADSSDGGLGDSSEAGVGDAGGGVVQDREEGGDAVEEEAAVPACSPGEIRCGPDFTCRSVTGDPSNCGFCGNLCSRPAHSSPTCAVGRCGYFCETGWADCDGMVSNGCEVNLNTDTGNCGACGAGCVPRPHTRSSVCAAGSCTFACETGWGDCNGNPVDGCEVNLSTEARNCGSCGTVCPVRGNSTPTCAAGSCGLSCRAGWADCNRDPSDGCEVNLATPENCGSCNMGCNPGQTCFIPSTPGGSTECRCASGRFCGTVCMNPTTCPYCPTRTRACSSVP